MTSCLAEADTSSNIFSELPPVWKVLVMRWKSRYIP
jgi:hypothetical protein